MEHTLNKIAVCFMFQTNAFFYQKIRKVILVHLIKHNKNNKII